MRLLQAGYIVLADRYIYTAFARDIVRGADREWVESEPGKGSRFYEKDI